MKSATFVIPLPPHPKERPRFSARRDATKRDGIARTVRNDRAYESWKANVRAIALAQSRGVRFDKPVRIDVMFHEERIHVTISELDDDRIKLDADIDNLVGGLLDALQPKRRRCPITRTVVHTDGVIDDDRLVRVLTAAAAKVAA